MMMMMMMMPTPTHDDGDIHIFCAARKISVLEYTVWSALLSSMTCCTLPLSEQPWQTIQPFSKFQCSRCLSWSVQSSLPHSPLAPRSFGNIRKTHQDLGGTWSQFHLKSGASSLWSTMPSSPWQVPWVLDLDQTITAIQAGFSFPQNLQV